MNSTPNHIKTEKKRTKSKRSKEKKTRRIRQILIKITSMITLNLNDTNTPIKKQ